MSRNRPQPQSRIPRGNRTPEPADFGRREHRDREPRHPSIRETMITAMTTAMAEDIEGVVYTNSITVRPGDTFTISTGGGGPGGATYSSSPTPTTVMIEDNEMVVRALRRLPRSGWVTMDGTDLPRERLTATVDLFDVEGLDPQMLLDAVVAAVRLLRRQRGLTPTMALATRGARKLNPGAIQNLLDKERVEV